MSEEVKGQEQILEQPTEIEVSADVGFQIRLQEFDKNIAAHKAEAAKIEAEKASFIYNSNIDAITRQHRAKVDKSKE